ncbi:hypothetical protein Tco_1378150 [Tanacetum coccineum]
MSPEIWRARVFNHSDVKSLPLLPTIGWEKPLVKDGDAADVDEQLIDSHDRIFDVAQSAASSQSSCCSCVHEQRTILIYITSVVESSRPKKISLERCDVGPTLEIKDEVKDTNVTSNQIAAPSISHIAFSEASSITYYL